MKVFLGGMLGLMLAFGLAMSLPAEENDFTDMQSSLSSNSDANMNAEYTLFAAGTASNNQNFSTGRLVGAGFMNLFLGLGSYTMGDWRGGLWLTLFDVLTIPALALSISIWVQHPETWAFPKPFTLGLGVAMDVITLMPVWYGIVVVAWVVYTIGPYLGIVSYALNLTYKFIRPFEYAGQTAKTARLDDLRNWDIALMPNENRKVSGQIAFTAHF